MSARLACLLATCALGLAGCAGTPQGAPAARDNTVPLANPGFEAAWAPEMRCAPGWSCSAHSNPDSFKYLADEKIFATGTRSMRVEPVTNEPWALATQYVRDRTLNGARLRYSLMVRVEGATGKGAGAFYLAQGGGGVTIDHRQSLAKGTVDWQRVSVEFKVPQGAEGFEIGLIVEGPGRVWIDDARLELLEPGPAGKKPL